MCAEHRSVPEPGHQPHRARALGLSGDVRPILIDTDVAADDLVAIAFLLASPRVDVEAITVSGTGEAPATPA